MSRPNEVEHEAVSRMIDMAKASHGSGFIVHSTRQALKEIEEAKEEGVRSTARHVPIPVPDRGKVPSSRFQGPNMSAARRPEAAETRKPWRDLRRDWIRYPRITVPLTKGQKLIWAWGLPPHT